MLNLRRIRLPIWAMLVIVALAAVAFTFLRTPETQIVDTKLGTGPPVKPGDTVSVHYTGTLAGGKVFDSSKGRNVPFRFTDGKGMVIRGWDIGVVGMQVGGIRQLIIPPNEAYGDRGLPPVIPPKSTLYFEIELLKIE